MIESNYSTHILMTDSFIDIFNHIIQFNEKTMYVAFHSKTFQPYFNANHVWTCWDIQIAKNHYGAMYKKCI
jgi:hypothetical protein